MTKDLDKNKLLQKRYFSVLTMMIYDLFELSESYEIRGYTIRNIFDRYGVEIFADKKRCRLKLLLPDNDKVTNVWHSELLRNFKKCERTKNHIKAVVKNVKN